MSAGEPLGEVPPIRQAEYRRVVPQNQSPTTRMFAAIIASALVLPAIGAVIDTAGLRSSALSLLGFAFLIGFGVPYYIFLRGLWKSTSRATLKADKTCRQGLLKKRPSSYLGWRGERSGTRFRENRMEVGPSIIPPRSDSGILLADAIEAHR